jgi:serine phosphatase RsbU (regulator of sigma subunit)
MILRSCYTFLFICLFFGVFAQRKERIEKLKQKIASTQGNEDTNRVKDLILLSRLMFKGDNQHSLKYSEEAVKIAAKLKRIDLQMDAWNATADGFWYLAEYDRAFDYYYKAYKLADSIGNKGEIALSLYNLGWLSCIDQKNYKDITYLYRSLQISRDMKDTFGLLRAYNALGDCYSIKYQNEIQATDFDSAVYYLQTALDFARKTKNYRLLNTFFVNLGDLFYFTKDYNTARFYQVNALRSYREVGDSSSVIYVKYKIALCDYALYKSSYAPAVVKKSYEFFRETGRKDAELEALESLAIMNFDIKDYKAAYEYYDMYAKEKAEVDKRSYSTSLRGMESNRSLEKAQANVEIQELKNKRKTIYISILIGIGLVIIVIAYLLFRQGKLRAATNLKLKEQNKIISEKKLEIEQSIEYAKGIQTAFLPGKDELSLVVKENFIFYKPKDVVSGDFYWYLINEDQKGVLVACADCTGHGVPGALMSMVGINILQQLSVERKMRSPALILKYLNAEIKNSLKQNSSQSTQRDGMDIAIIYLDLAEQKLVFSGANRPLYIVRGYELIEHKATKHAIGGFTKYDQSFEETKIDLQKNDLICLSTDGYADQFGKDGKKFMTKRLKELLARISHLSAAEQMAELESVFNNWKGLQEQIDDVCVIGLKV